VAALLILCSLALLTVYLRESDDGGLHAAQRLGLSIIAPFEVAGERVARPFQDAYDYVADLVTAKSERDELAARVQELERELAQLRNAAAENEQLRGLLDYVDGPRFPADYREIPTRVIAPPASAYDQQILVAAGKDDGVVEGALAVTDRGLVGLVTKVTDSGSQVTLLTDQSVNVSAEDLETGAGGTIKPSPSPDGGLVLDRVKKDLVVSVGDLIVTSGWRAAGLESLYPHGIPIGRVTSVGRQDIDLYTRIQVAPLNDFDSLSAVAILVEK
jgi:rod shape-determining protein MreC